LLIAVRGEDSSLDFSTMVTPESQPYLNQIAFMHDQLHGQNISDGEFAVIAIIAWTSYGRPKSALRATLRVLTARRMEEIALRSPAFALELARAGAPQTAVPKWLAREVGIGLRKVQGWVRLTELPPGREVSTCFGTSCPSFKSRSPYSSSFACHRSRGPCPRRPFCCEARRPILLR